MKQIIVITDGCSNVGINPVVAAAHAFSEGIVVNVIGVVDHNELGELGVSEVTEIAKAGGGMSRIVSTKALAQTVQMMTRQTIAHTIQHAVNKELKHLLGNAEIEELPPNRRAQVVQVIDDLSENSSIHVALLIDASASMKPKLRAVDEAIRDLMLSLQARKGRSEIAVYHFPSQSGRNYQGGRQEQYIEIDVNWTTNLAKVDRLFYNLNMKGTTPTGPALFELVREFALLQKPIGKDQSKAGGTDDEGGMLSGYVI